MHLHKYEKWWLAFGTSILVVFLVVVGVTAVHGSTHPNQSKWTINYEEVDTIAPFDNPGVHKVEGKDWDYEVVLVASAFNYNPMEIEVPVGSKVKFIATTKDVIHGFQVAGTNINMMLEPGYVSQYVATVDKVGEYTIVCNEYCGIGHAMMYSTLKVVE
ncbi:cytochrome c oxidase subunit II [Ureibacillus manganicus]|uniref:Cytochrome aa3 subunit 2 n=1 Tax=Ureibacillus manganicus DSM 26584 TaxID=1384049 RepID=A0A0A3I437_9BACL|nr:cytochrome c oxidase subunit II [Ureibacillus manganicus]KGR79494.1 cytochrome B5 [Ureibacillus manganicus DSM 26584]